MTMLHLPKAAMDPIHSCKKMAYYNTKEESKNNFFVALLTFGEGWHNNHHHYPGSIRQGFYWWEVDLTYYALRFLSFLGIVYNLRTVSKAIRQKHN